MLKTCGNFSFNYSLQEAPKLQLSKWVNVPEMIEILQSFKNDKKSIAIYMRRFFYKGDIFL